MKYLAILLLFLFIFFVSACSGTVELSDRTELSLLPKGTHVNPGETKIEPPVITSTATRSPLVVQIFPTAPVVTLPASAEPQLTFQGDRAYQDVIVQVGFGPRTPGSQGHAQTIEYLRSELEEAGWHSLLQETQFGGREVRNVIASRGDLEAIEAPWIILGAHYDTRLIADRDPDANKYNDPVPGANDGASGVAILLELARVLPEELGKRVWLVFFDAEDNGRLPGWDWALGSQAFVLELGGTPQAAVIVDMVGDADLNIQLEQNSDPRLAAQIWRVANELGYGDRIINAPGKHIIDDHLPFLEAGIPAVDIIDIDYPYWHTTGDTTDKVLPESLQVVGDTLLAWLKQPWSP